MSDDIVYGWHFLSTEGKAYGGHVQPPVGEWEPPVENPEPCVRGYHGSPTILKALEFATGPILGRCEFRGVIWHSDGKKWAARERRCIARVDASRLLRYFAAHVAEDAMRAAGWTDSRSWAATRAARDFVDGKIDSAAWSAACSAARSAAQSATESAAWSATESAACSATESAACSAAWSATWSAACSAAWSAAERAAESAARSAAWSATWSAARSAAWTRASAWLESAALDLDVEPAWTGGQPSVRERLGRDKTVPGHPGDPELL